MNLLEAIYKWCDSNLVAEFRSVIEVKYEDRIDAMVAMSGPDEWKVRRYHELRHELFLQLGILVENGTLIVTGFSALTPLGPPSELSADLWSQLAFDLRESSARLQGVKIIGIKLTLASQENFARVVTSPQASDGSSMPQPTDQTSVSTPSAPATSSLTSSAPREPRMVIKRSSCQVTIDRVPVSMPRRSAEVLIVLAENLIAGAGPLSTAKLKQTLFAEVTADNAVAVLIKSLRKDLRTDRRASLVQTHGRLGYVLRLEPADVTILP